MVVASRLPCCQPATLIASRTTNGAGTIAEPHPTDKNAGVDINGGSRPGPVSLLDKYTYRETVRTVIEEDDLPELPDFLESINLGDRLDVSWGLFDARWFTSFRSCSVLHGLDFSGTIQANGEEPTIRHGGEIAMVRARAT